MDLIAGRDERLNPQPAIGLDPDHDLAGFVRVTRQEFVQLADPVQSLGKTTSLQRRAVPVQHLDVVMFFGPVVANEDQYRSSFLLDTQCSSPRRPLTP